jgi:hypothetical protein
MKQPTLTIIKHYKSGFDMEINDSFEDESPSLSKEETLSLKIKTAILEDFAQSKL